MQVEVLPCFRLPRNKSCFTYALPQELEQEVQVGQFVEIPWRNKAQQGVVTAIHTQDIYKGPTKPILKLLEPHPSLTPHQLQGLFSLAKHYYTSPATLLSLFTPAVPKKQHKTLSTETASYRFPDLIVHSSAIAQSQKILAATKKSQVVKLQAESDRLFLYRQACAKYQQLLIVAANQSEAEEIAAYLSQYYEKRVVLWDNRQGKNIQWLQWNQIRTGKNSIVIGTRSAILAPFKNLSCMILDQQGRSEHKQWEGSPYLDTRVVVRQMASSLGVPVIETAFVPELAEHSYEQSSFPELVPAHTMFRKGSQQLSQQLVDKVEAATAKHKLVVVMPTLVDAGVLYCLDCEHIWQCPNCSISLRVYKDKLACSICDHEEPIPTTCLHCRSYKIQPVGIGLQGMKTYLESEYKRSIGVYTAAEQQVSDNQQIILTSPYQLKKLIQEVSCINEVALFHPEQLLYSPDFKASFQFYHYIHWHRTIAQLYTRSFSLQTDLPTDHQLLQQVMTDDYDAFKLQELSLRKQFAYPPYSKFLGISFDTKEKHPQFGPEFMGPFKRGHSKKQWLIKQENQTDFSLDKILGSFYNKAKIDLNPDQVTFIDFKEHA